MGNSNGKPVVFTDEGEPPPSRYTIAAPSHGQEGQYVRDVIEIR